MRVAKEVRDAPGRVSRVIFKNCWLKEEFVVDTQKSLAIFTYVLSLCVQLLEQVFCSFKWRSLSSREQT